MYVYICTSALSEVKGARTLNANFVPGLLVT